MSPASLERAAKWLDERAETESSDLRRAAFRACAFEMREAAVKSAIFWEVVPANSLLEEFLDLFRGGYGDKPGSAQELRS